MAQRAPVEQAWDQLAKGQRKEALATLHDILTNIVNTKDRPWTDPFTTEHYENISVSLVFPSS